MAWQRKKGTITVIFHLGIQIGNAATVQDGKPDLAAVADMLTDVAERLRDGTGVGGIRDANGNAVGRFEFHGGALQDVGLQR
jgi:hypothetical protein